MDLADIFRRVDLQDQDKLEELRQRYRLPGLSTYGVKRADVQEIPPEIINGNEYAIAGYVDRRNPTVVKLNRDHMGNQHMREVLAHESEHSRSVQSRGGEPSKDHYYDQDLVKAAKALGDKYKPSQSQRDYPPDVARMAKMLPMSETFTARPTAEELMAFLRGKEETTGVPYDEISPSSKRWVDANMFAGMPRFLEPTLEDVSKYYNKSPQSLSLRQRIRNYTSGIGR